jgi:hypothetical protein
MEEDVKPEELTEVISAEPIASPIQKVYTLRDWKEYLGESFLIIFSVLLALVLTEYFNSLHEKKATEELLNNIRNELKVNKTTEVEKINYYRKVLKTIDSAIADPQLQKKIIVNDEFNLKLIAPEGVLKGSLSNVAWDIAKQHDIFSKIDFNLAKTLTQIYADQSETMKVEDQIGQIILSRDSRKIENAKLTLILIRDNYHAWAVDRYSTMINEYDEALKLLNQ